MQMTIGVIMMKRDMVSETSEIVKMTLFTIFGAFNYVILILHLI